MADQEVGGKALGSDPGAGTQINSEEQRQVVLAALDRVIEEARKLRDRIAAQGLDAEKDKKAEKEAKEELYQVLRGLEMKDGEARRMANGVEWKPGVTVEELVAGVFKRK
jgi:hypothetical protein